MIFKQDLLLTQGETFNTTFRWQRNSAEAGQPDNITPYDFTNATLKMQFRKTYSDLDLHGVLLELTDTAGLSTLDDPTQGYILVTITPTQIADMHSYSGVFDLFVTYQTGMRERLMQGKWKADLKVTN